MLGNDINDVDQFQFFLLGQIEFVQMLAVWGNIGNHNPLGNMKVEHGN